MRDLLAERADLLVWLDLSRAAVMRRVVRRTVRRRLVSARPAIADIYCLHLYKRPLVVVWDREVPEMNEAAADLDRTFQALADPHRRAILSSVRNKRCAVGEIAAALGLSQQIVSHHLKVLRAAGLVTGSRSGTRHLFAVRVEGLAVGKGFFDDFWPERLSALKRAVESSARSSDG